MPILLALSDVSEVERPLDTTLDEATANPPAVPELKLASRDVAASVVEVSVP